MVGIEIERHEGKSHRSIYANYKRSKPRRFFLSTDGKSRDATFNTGVLRVCLQERLGATIQMLGKILQAILVNID
jgi:hypothetical protein